MYIPRWKRQIYLKRFFIFLIIFAIVGTGYMCYMKNNRFGHDVEIMDRIEPQYSTGGPFIMYNTTDHILGFYIDELPIYHITCHMDGVEHGIYTGIMDYDQILVMDGNDELHCIIIAYTEEIRSVFDQCTVLIYEK